MKKILFAELVAYVLLLSFMSCKKEKTPDTVAPAVVFGSSTHKYVKFTIGTTNYSLDAPQNGVWCAGSWTIDQTGTLPNYYKTWTTFQPSPGCTLCVEDTTTQTSTPLGASYYKNFFAVKDYLFLPENPMGNSGDCRFRGIYFSANDNSGVSWTTVNYLNPNSLQNGSTFKIIENAEYTQQQDQCMIFKATFNCKLFNNTGDSVMLTNGEMITSFGNY